MTLNELVKLMSLWTTGPCLQHVSITNFHFVSPVLDNQAFALDAFSMNWNSLHAYAFPPTILILSALNKICQSQCRIVLIAPLWPQQTWFSEVLQLLVSVPVSLPLFPKLLTQAKGKFHHRNLPVLNLHAWELSSNQIEIENFHKTLQILSPNQDEDQLCPIVVAQKVVPS